MKSQVPTTPSVPPQSLDQLLNSAVVLNWHSLTQASTPGRVRVEYHIGSDGGLENLKIWDSAREYWSLICDYSTHRGWSDGPRFCNGYHSRSLSRLLQSIAMNQRRCSPNTNGMLEVGPPTADDVQAAQLRLDETFQPAAPTRASKPRVNGSMLPAGS